MKMFKLVLIWLLFVPYKGYSQWEYKGLTNRNLNSIVVANNKIYVGAQSTMDFEGGIFSSSNNADTWDTLTLNGLIYPHINSLELHNNIMYCSSYGGLFVSNDYGNNWYQVSNFINKSISKIFSYGNNLFVVANDTLYLSTDNGTTWSNIHQNLPLPIISSITMLGTTIFAAYSSYGIYRSTDYGNTWQAVNDGLQGYFGIEPINVLHAVGNIIYAGTMSGIIFKSSNNGDTWTKIYQQAYGILCIKNFNNHVFVGAYYGTIYKSSDQGTTWSVVSQGIPDSLSSYAVNDIEFSYPYVYATTYSKGVWRRNLSEILISVDK
ncbi:MAG: hypothetical protein N2449_05365, partial [Bacteroidales bacterium]|nr:hypothetical protein [Bacteroidales bacterium]